MKTNDEIRKFLKEEIQLAKEDIEYSKSVDPDMNSYGAGYDEGYYLALEIVYAWMNGEAE